MRTRGHSSYAFVENRFFPKRSQFAKVESFATTFLPLSGEREKQLESRVSDDGVDNNNDEDDEDDDSDDDNNNGKDDHDAENNDDNNNDDADNNDNKSNDDVKHLDVGLSLFYY